MKALRNLEYDNENRIELEVVMQSEKQKWKMRKRIKTFHFLAFDKIYQISDSIPAANFLLVSKAKFIRTCHSKLIDAYASS